MVSKKCRFLLFFGCFGIVLCRQTFTWPNGVVPYSFGSNFDPDNAKLIIECLLQIEESTCLKFRSREYHQSFINFVTNNVSHCNTEVVGFPLSGPNRIYLGSGCFTKRAIFHEILHALGLDHEHQRPDRDKYVDIYFKNIQKKHLKEFAVKETFNHRLLEETIYDYRSVLHYPYNAFAKKSDLITIGVKDNTGLTKLLGKSQEPSVGDYEKLAVLYNCPKVQRRSDHIPALVTQGYEANFKKILLWPLGVVPFSFAPNVTLKQKHALVKSMSTIEQETCLVFKEGNFRGTPISFVEFQLIENNSRQRSGVDSTGAIFGKKVFRLKTDSYNNEKLVYWWLFVSLGMLPETMRPDRDKYIHIIWDNVKSDSQALLSKYSQLDERLLDLPYDLHSVMHYRSDAFAKEDGAVTIESVDGKPLGSSGRPTKLDFAKIDAIYNHCKPIQVETSHDTVEEPSRILHPETYEADDKHIEDYPYEEEEIEPSRQRVILTGHPDDNETPGHGDDISSGHIELVIFLCLIALVIIILMIFMVLNRVRLKKSFSKRQVSDEARSRGLLGSSNEEDVEEMDSFEAITTRPPSETAFAHQPRRFQHSTDHQYRQVAQDEYQSVQDEGSEHEEEQ